MATSIKKKRRNTKYSQPITGSGLLLAKHLENDDIYNFNIPVQLYILHTNVCDPASLPQFCR